MTGYVYILASRRNGTLYIGITSNLVNRMVQHREGAIEGFTRRYGVKTLVHYETFDEMGFAIQREKQMKEWNRAWKIQLIERDNPSWRDLFTEMFAQPHPDP